MLSRWLSLGWRPSADNRPKGTTSFTSRQRITRSTQSNSVTGAVLAQRNLGALVPKPSNCNQNGPNVGIMGTPVIVRGQPVASMYLVTYTLEAGADVYRIHALNISTLADVVPSVVVTASHQLTDGSLFTFNPASQRQRPGLLAANGNIYVGFGSHCDFNGSTSRGWILGWQQNTLTPLAANALPNTLSTSPNSFFLSAIWMSGYGLAADNSGYIYAATGNSDPSGTSYSTTSNLANSVVKLSPDLSTIVDFFTPYWEAALDQKDIDLGSGGVMVVPQQTGPTPNLLAAAGKDGLMFLLNAQALGRITPGGPNNDVAEANIGLCWCGPSYFSQPGGGMIVASGSAYITLWNIQSTGQPTSLVKAGVSPPLEPSHFDPGHFTTVSSSGPGPNVIIWTVTKPLSATNTSVYLVAFSQTTRFVWTAHAAYQPAGRKLARPGRRQHRPCRRQREGVCRQLPIPRDFRGAINQHGSTGDGRTAHASDPDLRHHDPCIMGEGRYRLPAGCPPGGRNGV